MKQIQQHASSESLFQRTPLRTLPPEVAERIAAGEVIERPVSVVKEFVENALDADAHEIRVEVRGGGLRLIRVTDDGYGIPEDELEQVVRRHTTSKIRSCEDLQSLHTLGFRGEALASIAAVAELTALSRAYESERLEEHAGVWLTWRAGEVVQRGQRARLRGTTMTVRDLFYNVPARLKFVHRARTENGHVLQVVRRYALGYPAVRFRLEIDDHCVVQTSGTGNLATALAELYALSQNEMLSPISVSDGEHYSLHGCIGNRVLAQQNRHYITLFINGRWIAMRSFYDALERGYRSLLPKGKHPVLALSLQIPPSEIDVNIHPAKTEVHLLHEKMIATAITQALQTVLERSPALPEETHFPGPILARQQRLPTPRRQGLHIAESAQDYHVQPASAETATVIASLRPLAQLQQAVILAEAPDGSLYLIDQHRAHERVIYEHLRRMHTGVQQVVEETADAHLLLEPVIVEMKRHQAELLEQRLPMLRGLGIECERFGGRSFLIRSVPSGEGQEQLVAHLQELAVLAAEDSVDWQDHLLIGLACRAALRRGRELGISEQATLIKALANVAAPAVCPHGSPVVLHYSRAFLIDKFDW